MDARISPVRLSNRKVWARHLTNFGPLCLIGLVAFILASHRLSASTPFVGHAVYGLVVALNAVALAMSGWSALLGTAVRLLTRIGLTDPGPLVEPVTGRARTAILIVIHEEDAARVFAAARTIADDIADTCVGANDVFVLSDSRSATAIEAERAMLSRAARSTGARLFYRRRAENSGRKAGNVADFVRRWGAAYDFMVLLDADSLMTGACIARLIGAMEANPHAGLIQAMTYPVGRTSVFARLQQFDSRLIGPVFQAGVAFWQGPRGNFWGHNAIVRIAPFAASCGLPPLPGRPPLGGDILSHDTVEAALLLRRGHDLWMLPHGRDGCPDDSWEETPTNLLDHLERDRRWLRGNLQHVRVLAASGLKAASYYHLVRGLTHFLYAPLLVSWLCLYALVDRSIELDALTILFVVLLLAPRVLGLLAALNNGDQVAAVGGRARLVANVLLDQLIFALLYPAVLVSHLVGLGGLLSGGETRWDPQSRDERGMSLRETTLRLGPELAIASVAILLLAVVAPLPAAMFAPGLLLGVPVAALTSHRSPARLFEIPEDARPHPLRSVRAAIEGRLCAGRPLEHGARIDPLPADCGLAMPTQALRHRPTDA